LFDAWLQKERSFCLSIGVLKPGSVAQRSDVKIDGDTSMVTEMSSDFGKFDFWLTIAEPW